MNKKGFTVIEILVMLSILVLGASLIYPYFNHPIEWSSQKCNQINLLSINNGVKLLQLRGYSNQLTGTNDLEHNKRVLNLLKNPPWRTPIINTDLIQIQNLTSIGSGSSFIFNKYNNEEISYSSEKIKLNKYSVSNKKDQSLKDHQEFIKNINIPNPTKPEVDLDEVEKLADLIFKRKQND